MHIVWDWNGTLFDDRDAILDATNEIFRSYGLPPMELGGLPLRVQPARSGPRTSGSSAARSKTGSGSGSTPRSTTPITA